MTLRLCFITGPTASGKSRLALEIAEACSADIVNCDSMQVYSDLSVLTARPTAADLKRAPHYLYGHIDGATLYDAATYARDATAVIEDRLSKGRTVLVVGGTGLYFRALLSGFAKVPDIPDTIRRQVLALAEQSAEALYSALKAEDPDMAARLNLGDRQRVGRALEVIRATGHSLGHYQKETHEGPLSPYDTAGQILKIRLLPDRERLYERCNSRLSAMIEQGGLDEISALLSRSLSDRYPVMRALGVPQLRRYLEGQTSLKDAEEAAAMHTRRFAKRQLTWIRNQFNDWIDFKLKHNINESDKIAQKISKMLLTSE